MLFASGAVGGRRLARAPDVEPRQALAEGRHRGVRLRRGRDLRARDPADPAARRTCSPTRGGSTSRRRRPRSARRPARPALRRPVRLGGARSKTWPGSTSRCRRRSARRPASSRATTARPAPSISSGPRYGLPPPICAHQNHYFWGPPKPEPENLIWLQWGRQGVEDHCLSVEKAGEHFHPWGMARGEPRDLHVPRPPPHDRGVLDPRLQTLELAEPPHPTPNSSFGWISRNGPSVSITKAPPNVTSNPCLTGVFAHTSCARVPGSISRRR